MIWVIEKIKAHLILNEVDYDLDIPILVEIEYSLDANGICSSSVKKKVYYNRPLLLKKCCSRSEEEVDRLVEEVCNKAVRNHFVSKRYVFSEDLKTQ
jgi:hypothetical protein